MDPQKVRLGPYELYALSKSDQYFNYMRYSYKRDTQQLRNILFTIKSSIKNQKLSLLDVGANIGVTSLMMHDILQNCDIYSFEPNPQVFEVLKNNFENNNSVSTYNLAVSNKPARSLFFSGQSAYGHLDREKNNESIEVTSTSIDEFAQINNLERINFAKIDVEGFEVDVLLGAQHVLEIAFFEFNPYCINTFYNDTAQNFLRKIMAQYKIYRFENGTKLLEVTPDNLDKFVLNVFLNKGLEDLVAINKNFDTNTIVLEKKILVHKLKESIYSKLKANLFLAIRAYKKFFKN